MRHVLEPHSDSYGEIIGSLSDQRDGRTNADDIAAAACVLACSFARSTSVLELARCGGSEAARFNCRTGFGVREIPV